MARPPQHNAASEALKECHILHCAKQWIDELRHSNLGLQGGTLDLQAVMQSYNLRHHALASSLPVRHTSVRLGKCRNAST